MYSILYVNIIRNTYLRGEKKIYLDCIFEEHFDICLIDWSERVKKIAKAWRELSSDEKQPFLVRLCFSTILNNY